MVERPASSLGRIDPVTQLCQVNSGPWKSRLDKKTRTEQVLEHLPGPDHRNLIATFQMATQEVITIPLDLPRDEACAFAELLMRYPTMLPRIIGLKRSK